MATFDFDIRTMVLRLHPFWVVVRARRARRRLRLRIPRPAPRPAGQPHRGNAYEPAHHEGALAPRGRAALDDPTPGVELIVVRPLLQRRGRDRFARSWRAPRRLDPALQECRGF